MDRVLLARAVGFGRDLLRTGDLDPVYILVKEAGLARADLAKALLGYSMFYHIGVALHLAHRPGHQFYRRVSEGLTAERWPRGTERRHYRGAAAMTSACALAEAGPPGEVFMRMIPARPVAFRDAFLGVQAFPGFGPWIAFKMADMADRTGWTRVDFTDCPLDLYRDPRKGAALVKWGDPERWKEAKREVIAEVAEALLSRLRDFRAPPLYDRPLNIQEAETIMCKFKGHVAGRYPVGKDIREVLHALNDRDWGPIAAEVARSTILRKGKVHAS